MYVMCHSIYNTAGVSHCTPLDFVVGEQDARNTLLCSLFIFVLTFILTLQQSLDTRPTVQVTV